MMEKELSTFNVQRPTGGKERPILFSGAMVRALLDGRKTQTRRVVKPQPVFKRGWWKWEPPGATARKFNDYFKWKSNHPGPLLGEVLAPYGPYAQPGDRLWVREMFWQRASDGVMQFAADKTIWFDKQSGAYRMGIRPIPLPVDADTSPEHMKELGFKLRPSIHMPRWASRVTLEIVRVRVERVQDISYEDALAEGVFWDKPEFMSAPMSAPDAYQQLWNSINAARGLGWDANPWVWVIEFKVREFPNVQRPTLNVQLSKEGKE